MPEQQKLTTRRLNDLGLGFMHSGTLIAAIELSVFDALAAGPLTIAKLARSIGLTEDRTDKLVTACATLELIGKDGDQVANTEETDRFLVRGKPTYFGDYLVHLAKGSYASWGNLAARLKSPPPQGLGRYFATGGDPKEARALTEAGYTGSQGTARRLAHRFDFSRYHQLLDLGGGSAVYSIEACRQNPDLKATVFDFENVCVVAREFVEKAGLTDRIEARALDFTSQPLPKGADVVLLCGNIHAYDSDTARRVVCNAYDALEPGGAMIICDYMLNDERTGPPVAAFISVSQAFNPGSGRVHSGADFASYLREAGFDVIKVEEFLAGSMGWAIGSKPAA
jgi:SAM-dependent methyltransferase